ncbi:MAG TPA: tetratricopeptide repeat protein [Bacillota bacterium]|jgi:predicted Zn-dependent protease
MSKRDRHRARQAGQTARSGPRRDNLTNVFMIVVGLLVAVGLGVVIGIGVSGRGGSAARPGTSGSPSGSNGAPAGAAALEARLQQNPSDLEALTSLGNVYYAAGDYVKAISYYEQAVSLKPGDLAVVTDLGTAYYYSGNSDAALQKYDQVLKVDPKYQNALYNRVVVLLNGKKDKAGAAAAIQQYLAAYPTGSQADEVKKMLEQTK